MKISEESNSIFHCSKTEMFLTYQKTPQYTNPEFQPASVNSLSTLITHSQCTTAHSLNICCLTPSLPGKRATALKIWLLKPES